MRNHEFTYPYAVTLRIHPVDFPKFRWLSIRSDEVVLLSLDDSEPDIWSIEMACASAEVASKLEAAGIRPD